MRAACVASAARRRPTAYAPSADVAVVVAGDGVYGVDLRSEGRPEPWPPWTARASSASSRSTARRRCAWAAPSAAELLLDRAATLAGAEMLGAADRVLSMTVDYAKDRVQFGKPIGSFQAVKHMLADALVDVEGMRSTVYYAAWCAAAGDRDRSLAASMAKAWCSDASRRVMATGLQVHGGIGFTWEHDMHLYVKRAQLDQVSYGDAAFHRDRIAAILRERLDAGQAAVLTAVRGAYEPRLRTACRRSASQHQRLALDAVGRRVPLLSVCGGTTTVTRTPTR